MFLPALLMRVVYLSALLAFFAGCGRSETPENHDDAAPVQRLIHGQLAAAGTSGEIAPPDVAGSWRARNARAVENTANGMKLLWGGAPAALTLSGSIRAADYAAFVVRMKIDPGDTPHRSDVPPQAVLRWKTPIEPWGRPETERATPVFLDGDYHTYRIPLWSPTGSAWLGEVTEIEFVPCSATADIEIERLELVNEQATTPVRLTIDYETHEAAFGTLAPWTLRVPPEATFETYVGVGPLSWMREASDPVTFRVLAEIETGRRIELAREPFHALQREADRQWRLIQRDLSGYAGEEITLHLEVDHGATPEGDYVYWGNPTVYARGGEEGGVPVILISNDTLRADHLGCYGYDRETSPHLDAFREDAVLFENAMCPESWTLPSHMTMLTGLYPKNHNVSHTVNLREDVVTLPEVLRTAGYLTAAYTGVDGYLNHNYGFPHGFDVYNTPAALRTIAETQPLVLRWLDEHARDNVFVFYHNFDIHSKPPKPDAEDPYFKMPYHTPSREHRYFATTMPVPPLLRFEDPELPTGTKLVEAARFRQVKFDKPIIRYLVALYDDGIRYVDRELGAFFRELKQRGIYDRALIIVTSDHGEEFYEHGQFLHAQIYEECHHVPLLVKFPGNEFAGASFAPVVKLADIFPTVLDVIGVESPVETDGQSLLALLQQKATPVDKAFGERDHQRVVRTQEWHLSVNERNGIRKGYDLRADPRAIVPVPMDTTGTLAKLNHDLEVFFAADRAGWNIRVQSLAEHGRTEIDIKAVFDSPVGDLHLVDGDVLQSTNFDEANTTGNGHEVEATLQLWGDDTDSVVMRPTEGKHRVRLVLTADQPVDFFVAGQLPNRARGIEGLLDPHEQRYPQPIDIPGEMMPAPRVTIWFEEPQSELPAAAVLTDEQKRELEALGYLQ